MYNLKFLKVVILFVMTFACQDDEPPAILDICDVYQEYERSVKVKLVNLAGIGGCGWIFRQNDTEYLEPTNLNSFNNVFVDGEQYWVCYEEIFKVKSICTGREMIRIIDLKDQTQYSALTDYEKYIGKFQLLTLKYVKDCGFAFEKALNGYLSPINIKDFPVDYINGKEYLLKYEYATDYMGICLGKIIWIVCLKEGEGIF